MAYDPQRDRRRPRPSSDEPAPIEAILDRDDPAAGPTPTADSDRGPQADPGPAGTRDQDSTNLHTGPTSARPVTDDPPPDPSVTPQPADPWSDRLLFGMSISTVVGVVVALVVFRWLWMRGRRSSTGQGE